MQTVDVIFKKPFNAIPTIVCTLKSGSNITTYGDLTAFVDYGSVTKKGFTIKVSNSCATLGAKPCVSWIATVLWNSNTCKNILNHAIDENNVDSISVDISKISTNGQSIPFLLILADWATGRCEMTYGCYRGNDKLQIPYILDTGNKNVICDGENLTVTFTMSSYCRIIYWNPW